MKHLAAFVLTLILGASPVPAFERLDQAWPEPDRSAGIEERVLFPSISPFSPTEIGNAEPAEALGRLFLPASASDERQIPAVVLLHGASGVREAREITYGRQFAAMGIAALVIDVFAARSDRARGFTERLLNITESMMVADAYAGLRYLAARPEIDPDSIVLIGFSYGGMATMYALSEPIAARLQPDGPRFVAHVAFYAPCIARFANPTTTGAPLLMLYGEDDALINPDRCAEIAEDMREGGSEVTIISYAGAAHQWDGGMASRPIGRLLTDCSFTVEESGTVRDRRTLLPMSGPILRRIILAACVEDRPYMIGADDGVRARSNRDLGQFLARILSDR
jgi:dienelactone hydrolase